MIAGPVMGFPFASEPLHTTKAESHTPAQTLPAGETVAILVSEELKVNVVVTLALAEFTADAFSPTTSPATMESEEVPTLTAATVVFAFFEPPQPAASDINKAIRAIPVIRG